MHRAVIAIAFGLACASTTQAADVKILTAGAMKAVVLELVPQFEKETGHKAVVDNDTAGGLARRIDGGEAFDLAIITPGAAAVGADAKQPDAARALIKLLTGSAAEGVLKARGMGRPPS